MMSSMSFLLHVSCVNIVKSVAILQKSKIHALPPDEQNAEFSPHNSQQMLSTSDLHRLPWYWNTSNPAIRLAHHFLYSSSSLSSSPAFFAAGFFFFLFLDLVSFASGCFKISRISSSVIFLSDLYLDGSKAGGAASFWRPFLVMAERDVSTCRIVSLCGTYQWWSGDGQQARCLSLQQPRRHGKRYHGHTRQLRPWHLARLPTVLS